MLYLLVSIVLLLCVYLPWKMKEKSKFASKKALPLIQRDRAKIDLAVPLFLPPGRPPQRNLTIASHANGRASVCPTRGSVGISRSKASDSFSLHRLAPPAGSLRSGLKLLFPFRSVLSSVVDAYRGDHRHGNGGIPGQGSDHLSFAPEITVY